MNEWSTDKKYVGMTSNHSHLVNPLCLQDVSGCFSSHHVIDGLRARYLMVTNVSLLSVRPSVVVCHKSGRQTRSSCGSVLGSWHSWFCCRIQIFPQKLSSPGKIFWFEMKKICWDISTASHLT